MDPDALIEVFARFLAVGVFDEDDRLFGNRREHFAYGLDALVVEFRHRGVHDKGVTLGDENVVFLPLRVCRHANHSRDEGEYDGNCLPFRSLNVVCALAGLGASMLYLTGYMRWECTQSSVPGMGFNGIAAAFLGGLNPIGAIFSSFFIQHITDGGQYVNTNFYSSQISDLISSVIIYLCGFVLFIKLTMNKMIARSEEKKARAIKSAASQGGDK